LDLKRRVNTLTLAIRAELLEEKEYITQEEWERKIKKNLKG
jgi:hypothetical protein